MEHAVASHSIVLGIATHGGCELAADSGLLVKDVVELERDSKGPALEEAL